MKKNTRSPKKGITTITRGVIYAIGFGIFSVNTILLPELAREEAAGKAHPPVTYPFFIAAWLLSIPIFIALFYSLKLLHSIDNGTSFSSQSVKALSIIKLCAIAFGILIAASTISLVVFIRITNPNDDAPPFLMLGTVLTGTSITIATFVAVMQKLLQDAIQIKSENDLTV